MCPFSSLNWRLFILKVRMTAENSVHFVWFHCSCPPRPKKSSLIEAFHPTIHHALLAVCCRDSHSSKTSSGITAWQLLWWKIQTTRHPSALGYFASAILSDVQYPSWPSPYSNSCRVYLCIIGSLSLARTCSSSVRCKYPVFIDEVGNHNSCSFRLWPHSRSFLSLPKE